MKKRADRIVERPKPSEEEAGDFLSVAGSILSIAGLFMRWKVALWVACFIVTYSFVSRRYSAHDSKQSLFSMVFAIAGLAMAYFGPEPVKGTGSLFGL